ncbi:hypothetical protein AAC387_Pa01g4339 [Persea americana]
MEFLTVSSSSLPPLQNHLKTHKTISKTALLPQYPPQNRFSTLHNAISQPTSSHENRLSFPQANHLFKSSFKTRKTISILKTAYFLNISSTQVADFLQNHPSMVKIESLLRIPATHLLNPLESPISINKDTSFLKIHDARLQQPLQTHLSIFKIASFLLLMAETVPFPSFAAETSVPTEQVSDKINIESILISIDDFFNRNPFFVATCTFIWLVVIPLIENYLKKFKYASAIDAFRKLKNDPSAQLLDIRDNQSLSYLRSPNLKILNKIAVPVEFVEGEEERFVREVLANFSDPGNTILCILDNFDGESLKVAELLFKNGFKEAYAIKGGLRGKNGWQEIQEKLLPPSTHVYPSKKGKRKTSRKLVVNSERINEGSGDNVAASTKILLDGDKTLENGYIKPTGTSLQANLGRQQSLSPYPNYPDMKPPSSPTPSKPN